MRITVLASQWKRLGLGLTAAGVLFAAPSVRAEERALYRWETADGTIAFTDDAKRVPEKYQATAETVARTNLADYGRYTGTDQAAHDDYAERLTARIESLRAVNEAHDAEVREAANAERQHVATPRATRVTRNVERRHLMERPDGTRYYRYSSQPTTVLSADASLPVDPNDPNPVVTEQRRVKVPGQVVTQTITVTRQGDRVLSVAKPQPNYHELDFPELSEFEN
jgi:hypothetical protein